MAVVVNVAESNNEAVVKILWRIGIRTMGKSVFIARGKMSPVLNSYIHQPTVHGIVSAPTNSIPNVDTYEKNKRMTAQFQYLSRTDEIKFQAFVQDSNETDLDREAI